MYLCFAYQFICDYSSNWSIIYLFSAANLLSNYTSTTQVNSWLTEWRGPFHPVDRRCRMSNSVKLIYRNWRVFVEHKYTCRLPTADWQKSVSPTLMPFGDGWVTLLCVRAEYCFAYKLPCTYRPSEVSKVTDWSLPGIVLMNS